MKRLFWLALLRGMLKAIVTSSIVKISLTYKDDCCLVITPPSFSTGAVRVCYSMLALIGFDVVLLS